MKKICVFLACISLLFSCSDKEKTPKNAEFTNNLIAPKSSITYEQEMLVPEEYFFFKSIDFTNFLRKLKQKSLNKQVTTYIPFSDIICNDEDLQTKFLDEFSENEFKTLLFSEEWALDTAQFIMKKKVNSYSLVRQYVRQSEYVGAVQTKSIVAKYDFSKSSMPTINDKMFTLLAENVAYEVPLTNENNPEFLEDMHVKQVVKTIVEKATCGNVDCYSFAYRDTLIPRSLEEVKISLGKETICYDTEIDETYETDTLCIDKEIDLKEITGLAFIEDWYINDSTMEILKEVKAIAPVRTYYHNSDDTQSELVKSIPFVMYLKNHDKGK
ncbi:MAG: hypothetical protein MJ198_03285 [Bacteroidales bacterium]|nr:hypothetical protein [Bacteroidales bacterium]